MNKNALFELIYPQAHQYCESEKLTSSIVGNLINSIQNGGYFRDSQYEALETYLWMKEIGHNRSLSQLIADGVLTQDVHFVGDYDYLEDDNLCNESKFLYYYFIEQIDSIKGFVKMLHNKDEARKTTLDILQEYEYPNYLYSLPMGAGKTFFMAACIYIDSYLYDKYEAIGDVRKNLYSTNSLILIPSAKKNSIIYSLASIKRFDPAVLFGETEGVIWKNKVRINVIDENNSSDEKLKNRNPNLAKIQQSIVGHYHHNVFIINAEKMSAIRPDDEDEFDNLKQAQQTLITKSEDIRSAFSTLSQLAIYIDEAHHVYDKPEEETQLRKAIMEIHSANMLHCLCVSGTPYLKKKRQIYLCNASVDIENIPDTIYYYPLKKGIGNFLKRPTVETISEAKIISEGLSMFFDNAKYNLNYADGTCSKVAIYCVDSTHLMDVFGEAREWCLKNGYNPDTTILPYYSNSVKGAPELPKENEYHFHNLDNPTSTYRIILLIGIGTEGWDCKSLTGVILPREKSNTIFVLQSSCRCLREVDDAQAEYAFICLSQNNKKKLDNELYAMYRMKTSDFTGGDKSAIVAKKYPVTRTARKERRLKYNNVTLQTTIIEETVHNDIEGKLSAYRLGTFQNKYWYEQNEKSMNLEDLTWQDRKRKAVKTNISFIEFAYGIIGQSFGGVRYADILQYRTHIERLFNEFKDNYTWFDIHEKSNIVELYYHEIAKLFIPSRQYQTTPIPHSVDVTLLKWNLPNPVISVKQSESQKVFPSVNWDRQPNCSEIQKAYDDIYGCNRDRMFNYYPVKTDSSYEIGLIEKMLTEEAIDDDQYELYYNGYTGGQKLVDGERQELEKFQIETPAGIYTPDFLLLKIDNDAISKILIIETKGDPYGTDDGFVAREEFVENYFLKDSENAKTFGYIRIGDVSDANDYNDLKTKIRDFFK